MRGEGIGSREPWLELSSFLLSSLRTVMAFVSAEQGSKRQDLRFPRQLVEALLCGSGGSQGPLQGQLLTHLPVLLSGLYGDRHLMAEPRQDFKGTELSSYCPS